MRSYICIDLKSFYASVECVERGLDPFQTNLVVADPTRSESTICLAITPAMKKLGVKNRCRIHEIPRNIEYITAMPRMQLYIDYSAAIYSIDECFLDVTDYLELYRVTPKEMAVKLMKAVYEGTGITASAGVGTNLYLAKIAMDILAKHSPDHIGILDEEGYRRRLWGHLPLTDFWRIGRGTEARLARFGIFTMGDIARTSLKSMDWLYRQFGIDTELLIDHAWGYEPCRMSDIKGYRPETHSLSSGQVLMRDYRYEEALVIVKEMTDLLALDLVEKGLVTESITLTISYDHKLGISDTHGSMRLDPTNSSLKLVTGIEQLYRKITDPCAGIRRIGITCNKVVSETYLQYDLFTHPAERDRERQMQRVVINVKKRYGKNAVLRGCNLFECSTMRERNRQIGGHRA